MSSNSAKQLLQKNWYKLAISILFLFPITSFLLQYYYNDPYIQSIIKPSHFLLSGAMILIATSVLSNGIRLDKVSIILIGMEVLRFLDALILNRTQVQNDMKSAVAFSLIFVVTTALIGGSIAYLRLLAVTISFLVCATTTSLNTYEWLNPGTFSVSPGRSAGWYSNPNDSALALNIFASLILCCRPNQLLALTTIGIAGIGVFFTLSRGGLFVWFLTSALYIVLNVKKGFKIAILVGSIFAVLLAFIGNKLINSTTSTDTNVRNRLDVISGNESFEVTEDSRYAILIEGIRGISQNPIFGYGTGSSMGNPYMPHNQLVGIWLDVGIIGALLYIVLFVNLLKSANKSDKMNYAPVLTLLTASFLSHNLLDNEAFLFGIIISYKLSTLSGQTK